MAKALACRVKFPPLMVVLFTIAPSLAVTSPSLTMLLIHEFAFAVTLPPLATTAPSDPAFSVLLEPARINRPSVPTTVPVSSPPLLLIVPSVIWVSMACAPIASAIEPSLVTMLPMILPLSATSCVPPATWLLNATVSAATVCFSVLAIVCSNAGLSIVGLVTLLRLTTASVASSNSRVLSASSAAVVMPASLASSKSASIAWADFSALSCSVVAFWADCLAASASAIASWALIAKSSVAESVEGSSIRSCNLFSISRVLAVQLESTAVIAVAFSLLSLANLVLATSCSF
ncbi:Uncharacterised protein [Yersinia aleksiciae]|uniref:Uncharacterized protein n=1 Tax=Yersinia aleksiciae TaxID=263819 RepID=A0A0T9TMJ7_YERAE|nr:Uncharacterised protein [Yersinia aleksiciae]